MATFDQEVALQGVAPAQVETTQDTPFRQVGRHDRAPVAVYQVESLGPDGLGVARVSLEHPLQLGLHGSRLVKV